MCPERQNPDATRVEPKASSLEPTEPLATAETCLACGAEIRFQDGNCLIPADSMLCADCAAVFGRDLDSVRDPWLEPDLDDAMEEDYPAPHPKHER